MLMCASLAASAFWVFKPPPAGPIWAGRLVFSTVVAIGLGICLRAIYGKDKAPDLLRTIDQRPYEREGFQFTVVLDVRDDTCYLDVYYQNRYERPCRATLRLWPSSGLLADPPDLSSFEVPVDCTGGGFGVVPLAWGIPGRLQGLNQTLEVCARVKYPMRRGRELRLREGSPVASVHGGWRYVLKHALALMMHHRPLEPGRFNFALPRNVRESVPHQDWPINRVLWTPVENHWNT